MFSEKYLHFVVDLFMKKVMKCFVWIYKAQDPWYILSDIHKTSIVLLSGECGRKKSVFGKTLLNLADGEFS